MEPNLQLDTKKALLEALETYHGIISDSCRKVGISRQTYYDWLKNDPDFKLAAEEINESAIDFVEGKLFERITGVLIKTGEVDGEDIIYKTPPSDPALMFYLKCKAKHRGYVERSEWAPVDPDGNALILPQININVVKPEGQ